VTGRVLTIELRTEPDVVLVRQRARQIAGLLGFDTQDQARIATAVSEIARNAVRYARKGKVEFLVEGRTPPQLFVVSVADEGPGIPNLQEILEGRYRSPTGMGLGIVGARRLLDQVDIDSQPGKGTTVRLKKLLPRGARFVGVPELAELGAVIARTTPQGPLEEVQQQNHELLRTLDELRRRHAELGRLNRELEDTNRGVVALYAELDEKAVHLRRADEMKSRFLSNMSHEFRTPLNSILAISRLLYDRADGPLTSEQEKQVGFIRTAAEDLSQLVNDLLDLAKVEAGKTVVRPSEFRAGDLFGALRGMLKPLLVTERVALVFEEPESLPPLVTDEQKISQILRNFLSNALKFTEKGEVRVRGTLDALGTSAVFAVSDTGMGIAPEDQERIFGEFDQVEHEAQRRVRGTGLGLPLSRRLAELLGGTVTVESAVGMGSTFTLTVPLRYVEPPPPAEPELPPPAVLDALRTPVLVVEDSATDIHLYEKVFRGTGYQPVFARTLAEAREVLSRVQPKAVIMDVRLRGEEAWAFLPELKTDEGPAVPVLVVSAIDDAEKALALGAEGFRLKPIDRPWLLETLRRHVAEGETRRALAIDDDEVARYVLKSLLADTNLRLEEASSAIEGLRMVRENPPDVVFLDLVMPGMSGFEVLEQLKRDPATASIPVVILTSKVLERAEHLRLTGAVAVLPKESASRSEAQSRLRQALLNAGLA
jgi:signal transduction histidine kinase/DNA-binding response OmpR family regulator